MFNGEIFNDKKLNGEMLNGKMLNGKMLNGELLNGELLNGEIFLSLKCRLNRHVCKLRTRIVSIGFHRNSNIFMFSFK